MRAALRPEYGAPDVIRVEEIPDPSPGRGEVLVRVHASTVNRTDCAYRSGRPWINRLVCGWPHPRVQVLGSEYAGEVVEVGDDVDTFSAGDRVCGFVDGRPGAHAELVVVAADGLIVPIPPGWKTTDAAGVMEGALYGHASLRVTGVTHGDRVLVHGATGAIGTALVQLLVAERIDVVAVCDRTPPGHPNLLTELGATQVIDLSHGDLHSAGSDFHVVISATGHLSFRAARRLLRPGGIYISSDLGTGGQNLALAAVGPVARLLRRRHVRFPLPRANAALAAHMGQLMESGAHQPVIDRTYDVDDIVDAYAYVDRGRKVGSVVVLMPAAHSAD